MATVAECEKAFHELAERLAAVDPKLRRRHALDRSISCRLPDLRTSFSGRLTDGQLRDIAERPLPTAQIKLTLNSDDLLEITSGRLSLTGAWAAGRIRIDASVLDLLRLRSLL
jgi:hypothetical protein